MKKTNILVIEDDLQINELVTTYLRKEGYLVASVQDGRAAVESIHKEQYELVILDIMLPEIDGTEVLRIIRERHRMPVIIISAKDQEIDKIIGLGLGADDYITKPFPMGELLARVKAQLRRYMYFNAEGEETKSVTIGELELNIDSHEVKKNGEVVILTNKEYELLELLMTNPKKVFTKNQLLDRIWGSDYLSDENTLVVHIRRLRAKIEDNPSEPVYVQTIWGIGYKLGDIKK